MRAIIYIRTSGIGEEELTWCTSKAREIGCEVSHEIYDSPKKERLEGLNSIIDIVFGSNEPFVVIAWIDFKFTRTIREGDCIFDLIDEGKIELLVTTNGFITSEFRKHESHNILP